MDWDVLAQRIEMWTTIVVNMTAIFTGVIVAGRWIVRRVKPTVENVSQSVLWSLVLNILAAFTAALISVATNWILAAR